MQNTQVVLVGPVGDLYAMPSLAVSLLKSCLEERGVGCRAVYANVLLYKALGVETCEAVSLGSVHGLFLERLFAPLAHEELKTRDLMQPPGHGVPAFLEAFYDAVLGKPHGFSAEIGARAERGARDFINEVTEEIVRPSPAIVGFSSTFQTTNAILAMAKAVRQRLPKTILVVGGNNCEGPMGRELAEKADVIDFVFQGEADFDFPRFCCDYLEKGLLPAGKVVVCDPPEDMDQVPFPDYSDFFCQCDYPAGQVFLPFETSRGCWWGHLRQCRFCGESALDRPYRMRRPEPALDKILELQKSYPQVRNYLLADSILPHQYFNSLLAKLPKSGFAGSLMCETKANLSRRQVRQLKEARVTRVLAGVESLSTRLLKMLDKGTTAPVNIRLLRHCREEGIDLVWMLLMGVPGDKVSDYEGQRALMPLLQHLPPPSASPVRIQRNSPYFRQGSAQGILNISPLPAYAHAFPPSYDRHHLACFFTADYPSEVRENPESIAPFMTCLERWRERWRHKTPPELSVRPLPDGQWKVTDTRDCAVSTVRIIDKEAYSLLTSLRMGRPVKTAGPDERLKELLSAGYLVKVDDIILSLVCDDSV